MFAAAVLSLVMSCEPQKRECSSVEGDAVFHCYSDAPNDSLVMHWSPLQPEFSIPDSLEGALAKDFATVPEVRHVLAEHADGNLLIWIAVDNPRYEVRERIYQKQLEIMDGFPEVVFDFNLVPTLNREPRELATGAHVVYSRS